MYSIFDVEIGLNQWLQKGTGELQGISQGTGDFNSLTTVQGGIISLSSSNPNNNITNQTGINNINNGSTNTLNPNNVSSGEIGSILAFKKKNFLDTTEGWIQGMDRDNIYKWLIGGVTSSIDWAVTTPNTLTVVGSINATTGSFGGFTIGTDYLRDTANSFGLASTVTGGNDVRFWAGDTFANRATAPLRFYEDGSAIFTNVTATGSIYATSGWIGSATALVYESQGINTGTTGWIRGGQTGYNTGNGYFLGYSSGQYKLSIGDATTGNYLTWDGTNLTVNDSILSNNDIFGDGSDGDVTISADTTLTADMYYNNLTINSTKTLTTGGYRIFVKNTLTNNGTISYIGNAGTNGSNGTDGGGGGSGGTGGAALTSGSLYGSLAGKNGGGGASGGIPSCNGNAGNGVAGTNVDKSLGSAGVGGGAGNNGGRNTQCTTGSSSSGGTITGVIYNTIKNASHALLMSDVQNATLVNFKPCPSSGSGGGGGAGTNTANNAFGSGGGGGASGSSGGIISIFARKISGTGTVTVAGGNGGNGGNGSFGGVGFINERWGGGGGAGAGGNGGIIVLLYSSNNGTQTKIYTGGTAGTPGNDGLGVAAGTASNGAVGKLIELVV